MQTPAVIIIPARYQSSRFPGKALARIHDRPMIQWVYQRACQSTIAKRVIVATDDDRIYQAVQAFGGEVMLTSPLHLNGTDRVAEVAEKLEGVDIVVNVQGDEPLIEAAAIDAAIAPLLNDPYVKLGTLMCRLQDEAELLDPNVVKVVVNRNRDAMYFSRNPIPARFRDQLVPIYKHVGVYVYRRDFLLKIHSLPPTALEAAEGLEQLRVLEYGFRIRMVETDYQSVGVDTPEQLQQVLSQLLEPTS